MFPTHGRAWCGALLLALAGLVTEAPAADAGCDAAGSRFPDDAGVIDVRAHGAVGDGVHDDTAAIHAAIRASGSDLGHEFWRQRLVYFPAGRYRVSDTIGRQAAQGRFYSGLTLVGDGPGRSRLVLGERTPGFGDRSQPKAVIRMSSKLLDGTPTSGGKDHAGAGEGNDAYNNFVEDLAVEVGAGNAGAVGIDYLANNVGAIRRVQVVAAPGSGAIGVSLDRKWPGPALLSGLVVEGFDTGVSVSWTEYGLTLEHVTLRGQRSVALANRSNVLSVRDLQIAAGSGTTPIVNATAAGLIVADGLRITGAPAGAEPIVGPGAVVLRDASAFGQAMSQTAADEAGALAIEDTPAAAPVCDSASVRAYGARGDGLADDAPAIQRALDSGAAAVHFPPGRYAIARALTVPDTVRRLDGLWSTLTVLAERAPAFSREAGMLRSTNASAALTVQRLAFDMTDRGRQLAVEHAGRAPLVLADVVSAGTVLVRRRADAGKLFLENVCCGTAQVEGPAGVWARQFDSEGRGVRLLNDGAPVWVLGLKTERNATAVETRQGGRTEVWGGLLYPVLPMADAPPAFIVRDAPDGTPSRLRASFVEEAFRADATYTHYLELTRGDSVRRVPAARYAPRGKGRTVLSLTDLD